MSSTPVSPICSLPASSCPFVALQLGEQDIETYVSDAKDRLKGNEPWQLNTIETLQSMTLDAQASGDPCMMLALNSAQDRVQEAMKLRVVEFRNLVLRHARTLVECMWFESIGRFDLVKDCYDKLIVLGREIEDKFQENQSELSVLVKQFGDEIAEHLGASEHHSHRSALSTSVARTLGSLSVASLGLLGIGYYFPKALGNTSFTSRWYAPTHKVGDKIFYNDANPQIKFAANWFMKLGAVGLGGFALLSVVWLRISLHKQKAVREKALARAKALQVKFLRQNHTMWTGMIVSVEDLQQTTNELKGLSNESTFARQACLSDIRWKLFGMSMAVDEYIFWLSKNKCFPANFSIRSLMQPARYDRIKSMIEETQPSSTRTGASEV